MYCLRLSVCVWLLAIRILTSSLVGVAIYFQGEYFTKAKIDPDSQFSSQYLSN
jgi:hypothetical protein